MILIDDGNLISWIMLPACAALVTLYRIGAADRWCRWLCGQRPLPAWSVARHPKRELGRRGQVTMEYFLIFAAVAAVTWIVASQFDDDVRVTMESFFNDAADSIANPSW